MIHRHIEHLSIFLKGRKIGKTEGRRKGKGWEEKGRGGEGEKRGENGRGGRSGEGRGKGREGIQKQTRRGKLHRP